MLGSNLAFLFMRWTHLPTFFRDIRLWPLSLIIPRLSKSTNDMDSAKIIFTSVFLAATFSHLGHPQFICWYGCIYPLLMCIADLPLELQLIFTIANDHGFMAPRYGEMKWASALVHVVMLYKFWKGQTIDKRITPGGGTPGGKSENE